MKCKYCGKEIKKDADICLNCGKIIIKEPTKNKIEKIPGNGKSIAGMILGIIAVTWGLLQLLSVGTINFALHEIKYLYQFRLSLTFIYFWFAFGYTLFSLIPSLVGLPLSISGYKKRKTGKNVTGIILNIIGLSISLIIFIYIMLLV